jgi:pimeloyl-ACP methyl ester carboxylesterase
VHKDCLWTKSCARLHCVKHDKNSSLNWIFLPGGPGLGSESLSKLTGILQSKSLRMPGSLWHLDLPGDGSNTSFTTQESFQNWPLALVESVQQFKHVILVAHSTGGMYILSTPKIEPFLEGLILLDSAPDARWQASFAELAQKHPLPNAEILQKQFQSNPNNDTLKALTIASSPYLFTEKGLEEGTKMLECLPYNYEAYKWSHENFDRTYEAKWIPQKIPTLIIAGENDLVTPLHLFSQSKVFCRDNILLQSIHNAGHFPWIDNPEEVAAAFQMYCQWGNFSD